MRIRREVYELIRKYRRAADITQRELAEALCVDRSTVAKWETGKSKPKKAECEKMAKIFDCNVDELLKGGTDEREGTRIT